MHENIDEGDGEWEYEYYWDQRTVHNYGIRG